MTDLDATHQPQGGDRSYEPMRNARADFDPVNGPWSWIVDDTGVEWRQLVAVPLRRGQWPFAGKRSGVIRLAPDWAFYSWHPHYALAEPVDGNPHLALVSLCCGPSQTRVEATLDLRARTWTWTGPTAVSGNGRQEANAKARKLAGFFTASIDAWRRGDTPRPVTAADLQEEIERGRQ